jgi:hypothetical protein
MIFCEWRFTLGHFNRRNPKTPHIRLCIITCLSDDFRGHPERCAYECVAECTRELRSDTEISEFDLSRGREEDIGGLDITVDSTLRVEVVKALKKLAADDGDVRFRKDSGLEKVETGAAGEILHDDPELVVDDEGTIVSRYVFGLVLGEVSDLLLNLRYVVVRVFKVCAKRYRELGQRKD